MAFVHIKKQLKFFINEGHDITLVTTYDREWEKWLLEIGASIHYIKFTRNISIFNDIITLLRLWFFFLKNDADIIHSSTPKAGLLVAIAAFFSAKPVRIHTFTGQRWANFTGIKRKFFIWLDRIIVMLNTHCYSDSASQNRYLISNGVASTTTISTIAFGSYGGIDLDRFNCSKINSSTFNQLNLSTESFKFIFVGRVTRDKGICELIQAFERLKDQDFNVDLLIVGPYEKELDPLPDDIETKINDSSNIHMIGFYSKPEELIAFCDCFCLPSYREGFGTVILESAALGVPAIGTNIPGLEDSIVDRETGLLVPPFDVEQLTDAMREIMQDKELCQKLGQQAERRVRDKFNYQFLADEQLKEYKRLLKY